MLEKITDYEYAQIESAINGILGIRNNISQYILDSLFQSAESFNKNWKGEAETLFEVNLSCYTMQLVTQIPQHIIWQ